MSADQAWGWVAALRAGSTGTVLGHRVAAPSTVGSFLRAFSFARARQLDAVADHHRAAVDRWT